MNVSEPRRNAIPRVELTGFWAELAPQNKGALLRDAALFEFAAGDLIEISFGLMISGTAGLEYSVGDGRRCVAELLHTGDMINMARHERQSQGMLIALVDCCVLSLNKYDFDVLARHHEDILQAYHRQLEDQTGRLRDHVNDLAAKTPLERIVSVLFELRRWPDASTSETAEMVLPILYKDIAAYTGMKPETVSRALRKLREARLISTDGVDKERISLLNLPRLRRIANGGAPRNMKL